MKRKTNVNHKRTTYYSTNLLMGFIYVQESVINTRYIKEIYSLQDGTYMMLIEGCKHKILTAREYDEVIRNLNC